MRTRFKKKGELVNKTKRVLPMSPNNKKIKKWIEHKDCKLLNKNFLKWVEIKIIVKLWTIKLVLMKEKVNLIGMELIVLNLLCLKITTKEK